MVHLRQLHEKYGDRVQFLFVYIREAGHELPEALRQFAEAPSAPAHSRFRLLPRIRAGMKHYQLRFPCLIDNADEEVEKLYKAFPAHIFIVGSDGRIAMESGIPLFSWKKITDYIDSQKVYNSPPSAETHG